MITLTQICNRLSITLALTILLIPGPFFVYIIPLHAQTATPPLTRIISEFDKFSSQPTTIHFENHLDIRSQGGHIQGIQGLIYGQNEYFILSGSSDLHAYYAIVKTGSKNLVISNNILLEKPFKHAGGFQIFENLMAIGVEDNDSKKSSKVFVFQIDNPERPPETPVGIIERLGTQKRATAGCVAITGIAGKILIVVGDWDTVNLDFYLINREKLGIDPNALVLEYSLNTRKADKSEWIDESWLSYQNINFVHNPDGQLILAAMAGNANGENVLDLYQVSTIEFETFALKKVYSKNFGINAEAKFRWGGGINFLSDGKMQLLAAPEHIGNQSVIHIYQ